MLKECWKQKINWDAELPAAESKKLLKRKTKILKLRNIAVPSPRCVFLDLEGKLSLHAFCDAREIACAICIFSRNENEEYMTC